MLASENENADVLGTSENKMGVAKFQHLDQSASQKKCAFFLVNLLKIEDGIIGLICLPKKCRERMLVSPRFFSLLDSQVYDLDMFEDTAS